MVLVPAHNEEEAIEETLESLFRQTRPVDRIIVVCDNCTDRTEEIIEPLDCETFRSKNNTQKKAGALNQALTPLYTTLADNDKVLVMDADSILDERFVEECCKLLDDDPQIGAISAAYVGKDKPGFLPMLQRIEYSHERRRVARRQARVTCLSGTAAMFTMAALRHLLDRAGQGRPRPGRQARGVPVGVADRGLRDHPGHEGHRATGLLSPRQCISHTDVMPTVSMLWSQRLRWQRGTLETLRLYGFTKLT